MHQADSSGENSFVTLTYADGKLPPGESISKDELRGWLKRFRKGRDPLKYYASGEYGADLGRPHYHACIFGVHEDDVGWLWRDWDARHAIWYGQIKSWKFGHVGVGDVTFDSARYVADYMRHDPVRGRYGVRGFREPPFKLSSQGLGKEYCLKNAERLRRNLGDTVRGIPVGLPLQYRRWLEIPTEDWRQRGAAREREIWMHYIQRYGHDPAEIYRRREAHLVQHERNLYAQERLVGERDRHGEAFVRDIRQRGPRV